MTELVRSNPDVGYCDESCFTDLGFVQQIRAGETLYLSGIAPLIGDLANLQVMGEDMNGQVAFVLEILDRCLAVEGGSGKNVVKLIDPRQKIELTAIAVIPAS